METSTTLLSDLKPFEYQVAGHDAKSVSGNIGILKDTEGGYLLKPINKSPQGEVEIEFYERINQDTNLFPITKFIPDYYGFMSLKLNNADMRFLKLKDVTSEFMKPCVMDVKIGRITWDPNASVQKRSVEEAKYVECKKEYSFCIPGYVVFNIFTNQVERFGKEDGKKLNKDTTLNAFKHFLNYPSQHSHIIIDHMIKQLDELLEWWNTQRLVHIFASSILLTYDAQKFKELSECHSSRQSTDIESWVKVYMIDFAHVFPANGVQDSNYISGLSKLLEVLKMLL